MTYGGVATVRNASKEQRGARKTQNYKICKARKNKLKDVKINIRHRALQMKACETNPKWH
eukprot:6806268-Karenia_brevis.AAC.1